jgi:hypothetical protein
MVRKWSAWDQADQDTKSLHLLQPVNLVSLFCAKCCSKSCLRLSNRLVRTGPHSRTIAGCITQFPSSNESALYSQFALSATMWNVDQVDQSKKITKVRERLRVALVRIRTLNADHGGPLRTRQAGAGDRPGLRPPSELRSVRSGDGRDLFFCTKVHHSWPSWPSPLRAMVRFRDSGKNFNYKPSKGVVARFRQISKEVR